LSKILLLEDDPILNKTLTKLLKKEGFEIDSAFTGEEAINLSFENRYDLYLFDINVPLIKGDDLIKELRDSGDMTPAVIISALTDIDSITKGFMAGADDYIKKPFDFDELIVRIKAKMQNLKNQIVFKEFIVDLQKDIIYQNNNPISLGDIQKKLLITLIKNYPNPISKEVLMEELNIQNEGALRTNIAKLKKKLNIEIENIRGVGYKII